MTKKQLETWIKKMGGRTRAAVFLGVDPITIWRWLRDTSKMKRATVMVIEDSLNEK